MRLSLVFQVYGERSDSVAVSGSWVTSFLATSHTFIRYVFEIVEHLYHMSKQNSRWSGVTLLHLSLNRAVLTSELFLSFLTPELPDMHH